MPLFFSTPPPHNVLKMYHKVYLFPREYFDVWKGEIHNHFYKSLNVWLWVYALPYGPGIRYATTLRYLLWYPMLSAKHCALGIHVKHIYVVAPP